MNNKFTILTDLDDVLWDLVGAWIDSLNRTYNRDVHFEDITDWEIAKAYPGLSKEEVFAPLHDPSIWDRIKLIDGSAETLQKLIADNHKVRIVTATYHLNVPDKINAFLKLFPFFHWEDVIIASDKSVISGDVIIDDGVHNLLASKAKIKLLFDRPHNRLFDAKSYGIFRVHSWDEIYDIITGINDYINNVCD